ncbi:MAG TPA: hypothetical protein VLA24_17810 [Pseudomonadales bacterium]|nr:hypothetical protein [Pseudomonadales bacterium]
MAKRYNKDPNSILDYKWDWAALTNGTGSSDWLEAGETIVSYTVIAPAGITIDSDAVRDTNTSIEAWLSGGTVGSMYDVVCRIVTSSGRQDDRTITVRVVER